jgi:hypothetical protein
LFGFTDFVGDIPDDGSWIDDKIGWHNVFYMLDDAAVRELLVNERGEESPLIGAGTLWN